MLPADEPADEIPDFDIVLEAEVSIDRIPEDKLYSIFSIFSPFSPPPLFSSFYFIGCACCCDLAAGGNGFPQKRQRKLIKDTKIF